MEENEMNLEEEVEETETEESAEESEDDFDFELDENGDAIFRDEEGETEDGEPATETAEEKEDSTPSEEEPKEDQRDIENANLRKRVSDLESQAKDTLKKLGIEEDDVQMGLARLAADAEDKPLEEYLKKREEEAEARMAAQLAQQAKYEAMEKADFAELKATYPEFRNVNSLRDLPRDVLIRFAQLRDLGLSAKEAYSAANCDGIRATTATSTKSNATDNGKSHLKSAVPKSTNTETKTIPKKVVKEWMEDLGVSEEEAKRLYLKTL